MISNMCNSITTPSIYFTSLEDSSQAWNGIHLTNKFLYVLSVLLLERRADFHLYVSSSKAVLLKRDLRNGWPYATEVIGRPRRDKDGIKGM